MKSYLFIFQQTPYNHSLASEAIELALAVGSFEQKVSLIFKNDGVLQLLNNQKPQSIFQKEFTKIYTGLDLFDIDNIYCDQQSLIKRGLKQQQLIIANKIKIINNIECINLIKQHNIVINI